MSPATPTSLFPPDDMASMRRVRRYAVPRWMIEESAARRLAGDWPGACAAARFDVAFDLKTVRAEHGSAVAGALESDLFNLVPDLVLWHLPRVLGGRSTFIPERTVVLAAYGGRKKDGYGLPSAPYLYLRTPPMVDGPQRPVLRFGAVRGESAPGIFADGTDDWRTARYLWDLRCTDELRARAGCVDRTPFFHADGTLRGTDELPTVGPGAGDPVARAEWMTLLHQGGRLPEALAAAGIEWDPRPPAVAQSWYRAEPEMVLSRLRLDVPRLEAGVRQLMAASGTERFQIVGDWRARVLLRLTDHSTGGRLHIKLVERDVAKDTAILPEALWRRLPDIDLLRAGGVSPKQLHPLVARALFPRLEGPVGPPGPTLPAPVRVRCRGEWHQVAFRDGALDSPHTEEERQRESAMRAFGGAVAGCFAVEHACTSGTGRLPRALRAQRQELFLRAQHGDTPGVLQLLDAGVDLRVKDGGRRSLLHVLHLLDHEALLPRLLAAGLDLEARDHRERTPLSMAVGQGGSPALVRALLEAGSRIDVLDEMELSVAQLIRRYKRRDLNFLRERVEKEHPGIGGGWWQEWLENEDEEDEER